MVCHMKISSINHIQERTKSIANVPTGNLSNYKLHLVKLRHSEFSIHLDYFKEIMKRQDLNWSIQLIGFRDCVNGVDSSSTQLKWRRVGLIFQVKILTKQKRFFEIRSEEQGSRFSITNLSFHVWDFSLSFLWFLSNCSCFIFFSQLSIL